MQKIGESLTLSPRWRVCYPARPPPPPPPPLTAASRPRSSSSRSRRPRFRCRRLRPCRSSTSSPPPRSSADCGWWPPGEAPRPPFVRLPRRSQRPRPSDAGWKRASSYVGFAKFASSFFFFSFFFRYCFLSRGS